MDGKMNPDPVAEFTGETSWSAGPDSDSVNYFFSSARESSILGDFGWNFVPLQSTELDRFGELNRIQADGRDLGFASECSGAGAQDASGSGGGPVGQGSSGSGGGVDVSASNPSVSSSSSEDPPEKSTGSGGKPPELPSKVKKKGQQRIRQPRFAFMTKSDVDHLEDGYRWRKYGQKAVKNSPYPRSYYRCTNSKCTVKKRVERSAADPTIVITTYEGQHCHHGIGFPRGGIISHEAAFASHLTPQMTQFYYPSIPSPGEHPSSIMTQSQQAPVEVGEFRRLPEVATPHLSTDEGLLGDIVRPGMNNRR